MTRYLRKKGTNEIFVTTELLKKRLDMEPYEGPVISTDGAKTSTPVLTGTNGAGGSGSGDDDPNRITALAEAISLLGEDGFSANGKPKLEPLSELMGYKVTAAERDAAFEVLQNTKGQ